MQHANLTDITFLDFALHSYTNIRCHGIEEFHQDLLHIKYIKKLFRKHRETGEMELARMRLAINHIIIFYNVFKIEAATRILFFKLEPELYPILKTFLLHLDLMPAIVHGIYGEDLKSNSIPEFPKLLIQLKDA